MNIENFDKKFAFVIMPFAKSFDPVYQTLIKPAVELCGINCLRADEDSQGYIHRQMLERIFEASVIIADISSFNPNVFYELGVAHSCGSKTIMICNIENIDKIPFDIAPYRILPYKIVENKNEQDDLINSLSTEIYWVIENDPIGITNPVQDYKDSQSPVRSSTSIFLNELSASSEEELILSVKTKLVYFGITANTLTELLVGFIDSKKISRNIEIHLCLVDPSAQDCWNYLYWLREGDLVDPLKMIDYLEEDLTIQRKSIRRLSNLTNKHKELSVSIHFVNSPPHFWAYYLDDERIVVGHLAVQRENARNLPVNILVKRDQMTKSLFDYYQEFFEGAVT